jgi:hypothetical protein
MSRNILFVILIIAIALCAACGGGGDSSSSSSSSCTDGNASDCKPVVENNPTTKLTCTLDPNAPGCK